MRQAIENKAYVLSGNVICEIKHLQLDLNFSEWKITYRFRDVMRCRIACINVKMWLQFVETLNVHDLAIQTTFKSAEWQNPSGFDNCVVENARF
jgi:hypothetical protein